MGTIDRIAGRRDSKTSFLTRVNVLAQEKKLTCTFAVTLHALQPFLTRGARGLERKSNTFLALLHTPLNGLSLS